MPQEKILLRFFKDGMGILSHLGISHLGIFGGDECAY